MMPERTGRFSISKSESAMFAALSGDYNPLHVDPVYSRRLQFGKPVIHGVHHLLRTMDAVFAEVAAAPLGSLAKLSATFSSPVSVGQIIDYQCHISSDPIGADIAAYSGEQKILAVKLEFCPDQDEGSYEAPLMEEPPTESPIDQVFPPVHVEGSCGHYLAPSLCGELFPSLFTRLPQRQLSQILACTRVVGMKAPGLHSIFSRINLGFGASLSSGVANELRYFELRKDQRVKMLELGVEAPGMKGTLDTFFRPVPAVQPGYEEVCCRVPERYFSGQRALVIGGSRGVGETTAKILAAGGGEVTITFSRGQTDAERIRQEIEEGGGRCQIMALDVTANSSEVDILLNGLTLPTHIYYFASPHIQANRAKAWDRELFAEYSRFYLSAFAETVSRYADMAKAAGESMTVFYPSSAFLDKPVKDFAEYTVCKAAGEALCHELSLKYSNMKCVTVRLPRMSTDQTLSIIPVPCDSVFDGMFQVLKNIVRE